MLYQANWPGVTVSPLIMRPPISYDSLCKWIQTKIRRWADTNNRRHNRYRDEIHFDWFESFTATIWTILCGSLFILAKAIKRILFLIANFWPDLWFRESFEVDRHLRYSYLIRYDASSCITVYYNEICLHIADPCHAMRSANDLNTNTLCLWRSFDGNNNTFWFACGATKVLVACAGLS